MMDLAQRGFGGSLSGDSFSCLHGDLKKEIFNGQTKRQTGPTVQDLVQLSPELTHGLLHLKSTQSYAKSFGENTIKYKHKS